MYERINMYICILAYSYWIHHNPSSSTQVSLSCCRTKSYYDSIKLCLTTFSFYYCPIRTLPLYYYLSTPTLPLPFHSYHYSSYTGIWGGLGTRILMIGTLTGLQWWIYDSFKTAMGLGIKTAH